MPSRLEDVPASLTIETWPERGIIADDGGRLVVVREHQVEVPVAIEINHRATEADAVAVESPIGGDIVEFQVAVIPIRQRGLFARRGVLPDVRAGGERRRNVLFVHEVSVDKIADHAGREKCVESAVVIEVSQPGRPRPAGRFHAGKVRDFGEAIGAVLR